MVSLSLLAWVSKGFQSLIPASRLCMISNYLFKSLDTSLLIWWRIVIFFWKAV